MNDTKENKKNNSIFSLTLLLIIFLLTSNKAFPQNKNLKFKYYTSDHGLSHNTVDCILKDSRGFMWFGTWNGLNRFDGYEFSIYKNNPLDTNTICNNFIYDLCEDKYGNLWIGTENGVNTYILNSNIFIRHDNKKGISKRITEKINVLYKDNLQNIWIGTINGLNVIMPIDDQGRFKNITDQYDLSPIKMMNVLSISEDKNKNIWIGTENGLFQYNQKNKKINPFLSGLGSPNDLFYNHIIAVYVDKSNILWVGFYGMGLVRFDLNNNTSDLYNFNPDNPKSLAHNTVQSITEDLFGNILIGTLGGLSIYNESTHDFSNYTFIQNNKFSLNNDFVNCIYTDLEGDVWIGTERGGINKYNVFNKKFESLAFEIGNPNSLSHNTVNSIYDDGKYLWIGTAGGGLNRYNPKTGKFKVYRYNPHDPHTINNDFITCIFRDQNENLWISNWGGGLHKLTPENENTGNFKHFTIDPNDPYSIINNFVSSVTEDVIGRLWIGTLGGLDVYLPKENSFYHIQFRDPTNPITEVGCLQFDYNGNLWAGTIHGLYLISSNDKGLINLSQPKINFYNTVLDDSTSISGNYVISILLDQNNNLWFGTYGNGFNKLIKKSPDYKLTFKRYSENDGLSNNIVYGILDDDHGNLWLSTEKGLSKFNINDETFKNYFVSDGLLSNQFYWSASYKNKEGKMFFGGMQGLNMFYPDSILDNKIPPKVALTGLKIYSQRVEVGKIYDGKQVLKNSLSNTKSITLSYKSKEFTIEFSALHYDQPEKNKYKYILEGYDKQWNIVDSHRRYATYSNLNGGEYIFKLIASNNDGKWSQVPLQLVVNIIPPFYKTLLFKILVAIMISVGTFIYIRVRLYSLKQQKIKLEQKVVSRTAQIEKQKEELQIMAKDLLEANKQLENYNEQIEDQKRKVEKQNEEILEQRDKLIEMNKKVKAANEHRIHFFTNISHEFRTPLTLILSPLEQILEKKSLSFNLKQKLQLMYKNARRLLNLINQLMELRKVETGKLDLKASKDDIVKFVTNISQSFQELSYKRNLNFMIYTNPDALEIYFDHEKIENIVYNLLSNAFKYTPEGGTVSLDIVKTNNIQYGHSEYIPVIERASYKKTDYNFAEIKISDSGIGIENSHIKEIFKMFYRDPSIEGTHVHGTGIGLSLVKELVKAHRGLLYVKSKKNKGSTFCVLIPLSEKYLLPEEIVENTYEISLIKEKQIISEYKIKNEETKETKINDATCYHLPVLLIVEDNPDMRAYLVSQLQNSFRLLEASNGKEGIEMAKVHSPDIVISDIMMPKIDGLELCAYIKSNLDTSHIPVILLTSKSGIEDHIEGFETGADDYIPKPFNISVLKSRITNILKNRDNIRKLFMEKIIPEPKKITSNNIDEKFLKNALKILNDNFHIPEFSVEKFASEMNVSRSLLHKKLVAIIGNSPIDFISSIRMKKAVSLLLNSSININEVAYKVGFNDPKYFSRCFKKQYGKTPSEFLKDKLNPPSVVTND